MKYVSAILLFCVACNICLAQQDPARQWLEKQVFEGYQYPIYPLKKKPAKFTLGLSEILVYNDNILQQEDKEPDTVLTTALNAGLSYNEQAYDIGLSLSSNYDKYMSNTEFSDDEHRVFLIGRLAARSSYYGASAQYKREIQPFDRFSLDKIERQDTGLNLFSGMRIGLRTNIEPEARFVETSFRDDLIERANNNTLAFLLPLTYNLSRTHDLIFELVYELLDYDEDIAADSNATTLRLGIRGDLMARLKGQFKFGLQRRASDDNPLTGDNIDKTFVNIESVLTYELTARTKGQASLTQGTTYSLTGDFDLQTVLLLKFLHEFSQILNGSVSVTYGKSEAFEGTDFSIRGIGADLSYRYSKNLSLSLGASTNKYLGDGAIEDTSSTTISAGLSYTF